MITQSLGIRQTLQPSSNKTSYQAELKQNIQSPFHSQAVTIDLSLGAQSALTQDRLGQNWRQSLTDSSVFDSQFYAEKYPDLGKNGVHTPGQLRQHWLRHGIAEGRQGSAEFNSQDYLKGNTDLQPAGIDTPREAIQHWLNHGQEEGRSGLSDIHKRPEAYTDSMFFDSASYARLNPDLRKAGLTSEEELKQHWLDHGIQEGRKGTQLGFDVNYYLDRYPDLRAAGIDTQAEAMRHYIDHGRAEGRSAFDPDKLR